MRHVLLLPHFKDEETGAGSSLPKVTKLIRRETQDLNSNVYSGCAFNDHIRYPEHLGSTEKFYDCHSACQTDKFLNTNSSTNLLGARGGINSTNL